MNEELLQLQYEYAEQHKDDYFAFPEYWFDIEDDKKKIEVLKKAIKEKKRIINVEGGSFFVEGITATKG